MLTLFAIIVWTFLFAQGDNRVNPSEPLRLQLDGADPVELVYTIEEAQTITVSARALTDNLDTVIEVIDPDGKRLAYNDDHAVRLMDFTATDSVITRLKLPVAGDYTLRVNSFNGVTEGEIEVVLIVIEPIAAEVEDDNDITQISVELPANSAYRYTFTGKRDKQITITARDEAGQTDPVLRLLDADGTIVTRSDDRPIGLLDLNIFDARLTDYTLPEDGSYTLELREFAGRAATIMITLER